MMCQQSHLLVEIHEKELTLSPKLGLCKGGNCEQQDGYQTETHVERSVFLQDADESQSPKTGQHHCPFIQKASDPGAFLTCDCLFFLMSGVSLSPLRVGCHRDKLHYTSSFRPSYNHSRFTYPNSLAVEKVRIEFCEDDERKLESQLAESRACRILHCQPPMVGPSDLATPQKQSACNLEKRIILWRDITCIGNVGNRIQPEGMKQPFCDLGTPETLN